MSYKFMRDPIVKAVARAIVEVSKSDLHISCVNPAMCEARAAIKAHKKATKRKRK